MLRLEYRRNTTRDGVRLLLGIVATVAVLGVVPLLYFRSVGEERPWVVVVYVAFVAIWTAVALPYAILNIRRGQEFLCRIDESSVECVCPAWGCGQTFSIRIADIAKVERQGWYDSHRWYLWDKAGRRYWLTGNYGNPADQIIELIRETNAGVAEIRT